MEGDDPKPWFVANEFGFGWRPAGRAGRVASAVFLVAVLASSTLASVSLRLSVLGMLLSVVGIVAAASVKGQQPSRPMFTYGFLATVLGVVLMAISGAL